MLKSLMPDATTAYFDKNTPQWSAGRYRHALVWLKEQEPGPETKLIDIGCGNGNILELIQRQTAVAHITGLDPSSSYIAQVQARLDCPTIHASILDGEALAAHAGAYDVAIMGDVLHHIVANGRRATRRLNRLALDNALELLKPGGHLIILEPAFTPAWLAPLAFNIKRLTSRVAPARLDLGARWANIGAPVILFFTPAELHRTLTALPDTRLVHFVDDHRRRLAPAIHHHRLTAILQRTGV